MGHDGVANVPIRITSAREVPSSIWMTALRVGPVPHYGMETLESLDEHSKRHDGPGSNACGCHEARPTFRRRSWEACNFAGPSTSLSANGSPYTLFLGADSFQGFFADLVDSCRFKFQSSHSTFSPTKCLQWRSLEPYAQCHGDVAALSCATSASDLWHSSPHPPPRLVKPTRSRLPAVASR